MAWPNGTRLKSFAAAGSYLPADANNVEDRMLQVAGYRGKAIIATEETRTNVAYGLLTTPDQVSAVVLPADGLIVVGYRAQWATTAGGTLNAAIFLGANQLKVADGSGGAGVDIVTAAQPSSATNDIFGPLFTFPGGLASAPCTGTSAAAPVTTGRALYSYAAQAVEGGVARTVSGPAGGFCVIEAAAGTYDVSVQFKVSAGTARVKNRALWVATMTHA